MPWLVSPHEEMPGNDWVFLGWFQSNSFKEYKQPSFLERTVSLPPLFSSSFLERMTKAYSCVTMTTVLIWNVFITLAPR